MKYTIVMALLLIAAATFAQAPKKTYRITVIDTLTQAENMQRAVIALVDMGYTIDKADKEFGFITTKPRSIPKLNGVYLLSIATRDKKVLITGQMKMNISMDFGFGVVSESEFTDILNIGQKGSGIKRSYDEMEKFAAALRGDSMFYEVRVN